MLYNIYIKHILRYVYKLQTVFRVKNRPFFRKTLLIVRCRSFRCFEFEKKNVKFNL